MAMPAADSVPLAEIKEEEVKTDGKEDEESVI